jgi:hypothetical protein
MGRRGKAAREIFDNVMICKGPAVRLGLSPSGPAGHLPRMTGEANEMPLESSGWAARVMTILLRQLPDEERPARLGGGGGPSSTGAFASGRFGASWRCVTPSWVVGSSAFILHQRGLGGVWQSGDHRAPREAVTLLLVTLLLSTSASVRKAAAKASCWAWVRARMFFWTLSPGGAEASPAAHCPPS